MIDANKAAQLLGIPQKGIHVNDMLPIQAEVHELRCTEHVGVSVECRDLAARYEK